VLQRRSAAFDSDFGAEWNRLPFRGIAIMQSVADRNAVIESQVGEPLTHGQVLVSLLVSLIVSFLG
jgi:hypothetical protein